MATFKFDQQVDLDRADIQSAALGAAAGAAYASATDLGKIVKMGVASNYIPCADGDDIEGHIVSVEAQTVNQGFKFGSVQRNGRVWVIATGGTLAIGAQVVAAAQANAPGAAGKSNVKAGVGVSYKWRVIAHATNGAAGTDVLIERV